MASTMLITGATGGIGTALTERLARAGHHLILAARDPGRLDALRERVSAYAAGPIDVVSVDMTDLSSVARFSDQLAAWGAKLDGVVLMPPQVPPTGEALPDAAVWAKLFSDHFTGPLALLQCAIAAMTPNLAENRRGKVVIVSGISSVQVLSHYATNNVIRAAWLAQAKTLAFALGERGIHVNTLSLGGTLSPHYADMIQQRAAASGQSFEERLAAETLNIPLRKYGSPDEVAGAVSALLSDFSDHLTGANIIHDGGFTRAY
ncbi:SDR family NAD(P)-dependent oxidoreductase [Aureimonas leprariae]|uniref:SDR family oxidoreductase n=1 Tax=Plantimonas leprariae TaxID=2615207 RepID=A0A7V7PKG1_9HYPH|nr:SDR family oxidoreductase [Aureimonas leprariae]KAB0676274.1 SDR family oxidoreductase [Aureimonas leprariae]